MDLETFRAFAVALKDQYGLAESTASKYRRHCRQFFAFLDREWYDEIDGADHSDYDYDHG